ncbi:MAG: ABC transporter ATP-binding protein [Thermoanaerobaculia bacterium]|nr:ABC transporter ATP-binding protein [Thermoanaerobaculia bacterium]
MGSPRGTPGGGVTFSSVAMGPAAELSGVDYVYEGSRGRVQALHGVDLTIRRGELTTLLGVNGSGKSTLLEILAAVRRPTAGRVEVLGRRTDSIVASGLRDLHGRLALARQEAALDPEMYVVETLELLATLYGVTGARRRERVAELVDAFDLQQVAARRIDELSGGQRRRLHLASSLIAEPELILLDEPTAGLDAPGRESLWAELARRAGVGQAVVLVTHELDAAERHSGRVVLLDGGRVLAQGRPAEVVAGHGGGCLADSFRLLTGHDPEELAPLQPRRSRRGGGGR